MDQDRQHQKQKLRERLLARRRALAPEDIEAGSEAVTKRLLQLEEYARADAVLLYYSFDNEVATDRLLRHSLAAGQRVILPRVNRGAHQLDLYCISDPEGDIAPGTWDIPEPLPDRCQPADIADPECIIVPGVGFDERGGRLGYGGGYYDRLLGRVSDEQSERTIGLCYDFQLMRRLPEGPFDVRMAMVCSDSRLIDARNPKPPGHGGYAKG